MRVRGRSEFFLPSYTRCARSISMLWPFREGIHLERLILRKPATSDPSIPSGKPTSCMLFLLLLSSISVIFSVSRSSWFLKSVTAFLSSRVVACTESTRSRVCFAATAMASNSSLSSLTELLVACMSSLSLRNAGISTESTASLTAEVTIESKVLCCSLNASLIPLAIASSISSLEMVASLNFFLYWRLSNLSFPIAFDCWSIHDESDAKCFEIYWQDNKIFGKFSRAKDYACIEVEGSRDLPDSLNLLIMLCTVEGEISKYLPIFLWGTLFLNISIIFSRICWQTGDPRPIFAPKGLDLSWMLLLYQIIITITCWHQLFQITSLFNQFTSLLALNCSCPNFFGMCCRSEWQERMYIYKWHEVDQTKHEIFCVHVVCNEIQVKVNLEITTFFFYLRFPYCPNFFWFGVVNYRIKMIFNEQRSSYINSRLTNVKFSSGVCSSCWPVAYWENKIVC